MVLADAEEPRPGIPHICLHPENWLRRRWYCPRRRTAVDETTVLHNDVETPLNTLPLEGTYSRPGDDDDIAEWAVPIEWARTVPRDHGFWKPGMFANQNTATKLRSQFTIDQVSDAFDLD